MNGEHLQRRAIELSVSAYQLLLLAYPREFRTEYGLHMLQVFGDRCRQRIRESGLEGILGWWLVTGIDFVSSVLEQHLRRENHMTRKTLIRIGSWALMLAAMNFIVFALIVAPAQTDIGPWPFMLLTFLTSVGTVGVLVGFEGAARPAGKPLLIAGVVASLLAYTAPLDLWSHIGDPFWIVPYASLAVLLACLAGYGLIALQRSFLPIDTAVTLLAGIWFILLLILAGFYPIWDTAPGLTAGWLILGSLITAFALARLGWVLRSRVQRPSPAA
jgi:hypothetical protein